MIEAPHIGNMLNSFIRKNKYYQSSWERAAAVAAKKLPYPLKKAAISNGRNTHHR
jgi:hypothetical protein